MRVLLVLAKYAAFGVIPLVIPSIVEDLPIPTQRIPQQRGIDYAYVKRLAQECGYVFYLEPGPAPGTSKAYWGPEIRVGAPQPALTVNMDALTNVEQLNFNFDKERKTMPIVFFQEPISKVPIPVSRFPTSRRSIRRSGWCRRCRRRSSNSTTPRRCRRLAR